MDDVGREPTGEPLHKVAGSMKFAEKSRYHSSTGFPCKKAQTFPGLMALCPELKPVYHGVLLRQYGEGLWEITP